MIDGDDGFARHRAGEHNHTGPRRQHGLVGYATQIHAAVAGKPVVLGIVERPHDRGRRCSGQSKSPVGAVSARCEEGRSRQQVEAVAVAVSARRIAPNFVIVRRSRTS
ncbi:hypothetical protein SAMN04490220_8375, partial [Rhodococcus jostii]